MILFALLVAHRVNSNCYKEQLRIHTKVAFTCVMDYTSLTGNFETEDFTMKIAVTYDNGNIFQHFGKTETFKVYEVEDNKVVSSEVIGSNGEGHGALAGLLAGQMIKGFDAAVADMEVGQVVDIHLMPEEAYGMPNPEAIFTVEIAELPGSEDLEVGQQVYLSNQYGQPFPVKVTAKEETTITFDANHEMAGKELNFKIELVSVE